jgi:choline dehydrogenase-like flavoprotein
MRIALASLRLAQHDPQAATAALAPVIDGSVPPGDPNWLMVALALEAMARDALGDPAAAGRALERALRASSKRAAPSAGWICAFPPPGNRSRLAVRARLASARTARQAGENQVNTDAPRRSHWLSRKRPPGQ